MQENKQAFLAFVLARPLGMDAEQSLSLFATGTPLRGQISMENRGFFPFKKKRKKIGYFPCVHQATIGRKKIHSQDPYHSDSG